LRESDEQNAGPRVEVMIEKAVRPEEPLREQWKGDKCGWRRHRVWEPR